MYLPPNVYFAEPESESDDGNVYSYWMKQNSLMVLHPLLLSLILPSLYIYLYSSLLFPPLLPSPLLPSLSFPPSLSSPSLSSSPPSSPLPLLTSLSPSPCSFFYSSLSGRMCCLGESPKTRDASKQLWFTLAHTQVSNSGPHTLAQCCMAVLYSIASSLEPRLHTDPLNVATTPPCCSNVVDHTPCCRNVVDHTPLLQ